MRNFKYINLSNILILIMINTVSGQNQIQTRTQLTESASLNAIRTVGGREILTNDLDKYIQATMDSVSMPGLSIAIINDAEVVYQRVFGVTNIDTKEEVTDQTIFEAASLSKPVFAYFAMKMVVLINSLIKG